MIKSKCTDLYYLQGHKPVKCEDFMEWATKFKRDDSREVAKTYVRSVTISTVFLGTDHRYGDGEPILFETMAFGGKYDLEQERYCAWDEAVLGHKRWVKKVRKETWLWKLIERIKK